MNLTPRQEKIIAFLKENSPQTGAQIAAYLKLALPTIRPDLSFLTKVAILDSKPKVGYSYLKQTFKNANSDELLTEKIADILLPFTSITEKTSLDEAVSKLFLKDVGSLYVVNDHDELVGVISRKDLLRATLNNPNGGAMMASLIMTRMPNVITVTPTATIKETSTLLLKHEVDSLPVVDTENSTKLVGKITKNRLFKYLISNL